MAWCAAVVTFSLPAGQATAGLIDFLLPQVLAGELRGEDKRVMDRLISDKAYRVEDKQMSNAYFRLLATMGKSTQAEMKESQQAWIAQKESDALEVWRRRGEDRAVQYLISTTEERRQLLEELLSKAGVKSAPAVFKLPSDPEFRRADATMSAYYAAGLAGLNGKARKAYIAEQTEWNQAKEREYLRILARSGSDSAITYLIEVTRQRAAELR